MSEEERFRTVLSGPNPNHPAIEKTSSRIPGALPDILCADAVSIYMRHLAFAPDLSTPITPELLSWATTGPTRIIAGSGFLDGTLFNRTTWQYGPRIDRSQMLLVDGRDVYGLRVYSGISWNCPLYKVGEGYLLFRQNVGKPVPKPSAREARILGRIPYERYTWHTRVPARVSAMVLAGARRADAAEKCLFAAGAPDEIDPDDPLGTFEARKGARLFALAGETGEILDEQLLESPPVWDGMIVCRRRLYVALQNGTLMCLGAPR